MTEKTKKSKTKPAKKVKSHEVEDQDFFYYNSEEDAKEVFSSLGLDERKFFDNNSDFQY